MSRAVSGAGGGDQVGTSPNAARRRPAAAEVGAPSERLLLTTDEAAAMLSIGRSALYQLIWSGRLTPVRIGRSVRFTREELAAFVDELVERR